MAVAVEIVIAKDGNRDFVYGNVFNASVVRGFECHFLAVCEALGRFYKGAVGIGRAASKIGKYRRHALSFNIYGLYICVGSTICASVCK